MGWGVVVMGGMKAAIAGGVQLLDGWPSWANGFRTTASWSRAWGLYGPLLRM